MWSIAGVVTRQLEAARSFEVTFWRSFFTLLSLLVILPLFQGRGGFRAKFATAGKALWISGVCWSVMFTAFMVALTLTTVANVLVTLALGPVAHGADGARLHRPPDAGAHLGGDCAGRRRHCLDVRRPDGPGQASWPARWWR